MGRVTKRLLWLFLAVILTAGTAMSVSGGVTEAAARPKKTSFVEVTATTSGFKAYWYMQTTRTEGYQIRYKRKTEKAHYVNIAGNTTTYRKVTGLLPGKKYYVRIRTYRKVNGKKLYSDWSSRAVVTVIWSRWQKNARSIYRYLSRKGMDDIHIAAILGCIYPESGFDPTSVETIYTEPYRIGKKKKAAEEADFKMKKINPDYAKAYPMIVRAGIGIVGWTDTKDMVSGQGGNTLLREYAELHGYKWYSLTAQLRYFWYGYQSTESYKNWHARSLFEKKTTVNGATHIYLCYALAGWKCRDTDSYHEAIGLDERKTLARRFYRYILKGYYD